MAKEMIASPGGMEKLQGDISTLSEQIGTLDSKLGTIEFVQELVDDTYTIVGFKATASNDRVMKIGVSLAGSQQAKLFVYDGWRDKWSTVSLTDLS